MRQETPRRWRIAVHDYPGHPFQMELSRCLAARGHVVRHFYFADDPGPKGIGTLKQEDSPNFTIQPIRLRFPYRRESLPRRFIGDALYGRAIYQHVRAFLPDVIISGNAPLNAQAAMLRTARQGEAKFVFWVQDLHGLAMQRLLGGRAAGLGGAVARHYTRWENRLLRQSDSIIVISPDFRRFLPPEARGEERTHVVMNWGPLGDIDPRPKQNPWSLHHGSAGKFTFMYTGTLGRKHDFALLFDLATHFAADPDVEIIVAASGAGAQQLAARLAGAGQHNIRLMPPQPMRDFPDVLGTADVLLAVLEADAGEFSVPSKVLSYLCAGRPILLSAPPGNLAARILADSAAGLAVPAGNAQAFLAAAHRLRADAPARAAMAAAGRAYAETHFDIAAIATRFEEILTRPAGMPAAAPAAMPAARVEASVA